MTGATDVVGLTRPVRLLLAVCAVLWAALALHLGSIYPQDVVGMSGDPSGWVQHVVSMAVLGVLVTMAVGSRPLTVYVALVLGGLAGEVMQLWVSGRTFSLGDLLADAVGAAVGVGIGVLAGRRQGAAFSAVATAVVLAVASPWVLDESPPEWADGKKECSPAPQPSPETPTVVMTADVRDATLPTAIPDPSVAKLVQAVSRTDEFMLEVWFETSDLDQGGPTQVFTISDGVRKSRMNVQLGVEGDDLIVRLRTACELFREVEVADAIAAGVPMQVAVTWSAGELVTYVDGVEVSRVEPSWGALGAWDSSFRMQIGAEVDDDRTFDGKVFSATMWDAPLSPTDIARRYQLGP
jgi:VanZ family protein